MKRVLLCGAITAIIIITSVIMLISLNNHNNALCSKVDECVEAYENKKSELALQKVEELTHLWEDYYTDMAFVVQSDKIHGICVSISKLKPLLKEQSNEFISECESIKLSLELIYDSHYPYLRNVI